MATATTTPTTADLDALYEALYTLQHNTYSTMYALAGLRMAKAQGADLAAMEATLVADQAAEATARTAYDAAVAAYEAA